MKIRAVETFVAHAEELHFGRRAERCTVPGHQAICLETTAASDLGCPVEVS
ncbi:hypothetical protein AB0F17_25765 [Nonomuraea sp. NPDC026600]|uniref:hypothetical protein n=1 Tax=Nonomuraea sp. NPDC026600 TaxID=3155363 RepID=UPI0033C89147